MTCLGVLNRTSAAVKLESSGVPYAADMRVQLSYTAEPIDNVPRTADDKALHF